MEAEKREDRLHVVLNHKGLNKWKIQESNCGT